MKLLSTTLLSLGLLSLNACQSDKDGEDCVSPTTIVGRWQLTDLQCFCDASTLPNEAIEFKADGTVTFYKNDQEESRDTYTFATGKTLCAGDNAPVLRFSKTPLVTADANTAYTIEPNRLVLDLGSCLDLPRKTYRRIQ